MHDRSAEHLADWLERPPRYPGEALAQDGFRRWLLHGDTLALHRCMGLSASPAGFRRIQRNRLLRRAATLVEAETPWQRAGRLAELVRLFELRKWPVWCRVDTAPPYATELERVLFDVLKTGAKVPGCQRSYHDILLGG